MYDREVSIRFPVRESQFHLLNNVQIASEDHSSYYNEQLGLVLRGGWGKAEGS
jgi:hypothetical protein